MAIFLAAADQRADSLYAKRSRHGPDLAALVSAGVRYFVARDSGRALGGGGYVRLADHGAEMKRLFVDPTARGKGIGASVVQAIERDAAEQGIRTLFLETGVRSTEALGFYQKLGFVGCAPFGEYEPDPLSVFLVKQLLSLDR